MARRKYRFKDRAEAEAAYDSVSRERLLAEWFASAIIHNRLNPCGTITEAPWVTTVGYFNTTHSCVVYALTDDNQSPHCIRGLWDSSGEQLGGVIAGLMRYEDTHELGRLLDKAKTESWKAAVAGRRRADATAASPAIFS